MQMCLCTKALQQIMEFLNFSQILLSNQHGKQSYRMIIIKNIDFTKIFSGLTPFINFASYCKLQSLNKIFIDKTAPRNQPHMSIVSLNT